MPAKDGKTRIADVESVERGREPSAKARPLDGADVIGPKESAVAGRSGRGSQEGRNAARP